MKTLKLALLIAASLLLTSCSSSVIPGEAPAAGGALPSGGMEPAYGKGGGRNNFAATMPQHGQQDISVLTE
ncbi:MULTISPECIES: hypothetical protein [Aeromonas]|uniref:Lipoprotein n=1 Tax=Aeromonas sanarellii TaxID=633415 RepID=A0ABS4B1A1_9GAMM|nr:MULTISPECIES: hypothetical protein [Aeromonas]MBL0645502.1 hypothetical protein [Aeromonas caviae]MBP0601260.1 hypothetical protein [Aeromonas sanarellii]MEB6605885.1 hypothetical protein [Aeromonas sanarellii]QXC29258.1 hypothetical protein I6L39_15225 [Aeromonas sp. FDAARGOS 1409]WOX49996.1 hypothetical protein R2B70_08485 [Aeromonas sp. XH]